MLKLLAPHFPTDGSPCSAVHESLPNNVQPEHATAMVPIYDTVLRGGCCRVCISWLFMEILGRAPPPSCQRRLEPTWLVVALPRPSIGFTILCLDFIGLHRRIEMKPPRRYRQTEGDLHVACRCPLFSLYCSVALSMHAVGIDERMLDSSMKEWYGSECPTGTRENSVENTYRIRRGPPTTFRWKNGAIMSANMHANMHASLFQPFHACASMQACIIFFRAL